MNTPFLGKYGVLLMLEMYNSSEFKDCCRLSCKIATHFTHTAVESISRDTLKYFFTDILSLSYGPIIFEKWYIHFWNKMKLSDHAYCNNCVLFETTDKKQIIFYLP